MQFKVGDKVKFLNDVGGGKIVRELKKNMYEVEDNEGFNIPVIESELILVENKNNSNSSTQHTVNQSKSPELVVEDKIDLSFDEIKQNKVLIDNENNEINLFLALVPQDENNILNSDLDCFFINDSEFYAVVVVKSQRDKEYHLLKTINIEPDTKLKLFDIYREKLNDFSKLFVQVILYKNVSKFHFKSFDKKIVLKANKIYSLNSYCENDYTEEPAILFSVDKYDNTKENINKNQNKLLNQKIKADLNNYKKVEISKTKSKDLIEIDLHIQELLDDYSGMSNFEMLSIQIAEFRKQLDSAILNKVKKIVFIHGVGEGKLKFEIRKILKKDYARYEYQDASYEKYGFGATMVLI